MLLSANGAGSTQPPRAVKGTRPAEGEMILSPDLL